jgi:hypothetical protein
MALQGLAADRPATPGYDVLYYATDTGQLSIYNTVGAAWTNVGFSGLSDPVAIGDGGTGQTTAVAAFDALAPGTTKGDLIVYDGTDNVRLAAPSDHFVFVADSAQTSNWHGRYRNSHITMFSTDAAVSFVTGAAYAAVFNAASSSSPTKMYADLTGFRQARIVANAAIAALSTSATVKIVDVTNTLDITGTITFNSATFTNTASTWATMNATTYGTTNVAFEAQAIEGVAADVIRFNNIVLELR